jgi:NADPH-dependent curcumin reductase
LPSAAFPISNIVEEIMTPSVNRQYRLLNRPEGQYSPDLLGYAEGPVPEPAAGEFIVRNSVMSLDPALRSWMGSVRSYIEPVPLGDVMRAFAGGEIIASRNDSFPVGERAVGMFGWQDYAVSNGDKARLVPRGAEVADALGPVGVTGVSAHIGLFSIGQATAGETVVISAAAGAVGSVAVQLAKQAGCHVIGIAGGPEKCRWVEELGADHCIDYKMPGLGRALRDACPDRIDVFFDNVGGEILDAALARLALNARVVLCGGISQYNAERVQGPSNYLSLLSNRARMEGFIYFDDVDRWAAAEAAMAELVAAGRIIHKIDWVEGLANAPDAVSRLYTGAHDGRLLVRL